jgi:uncharacterized membrane protein
MLGEIASLASALCWALSAVIYRKALSAIDPLPANAVRCIPTVVFMVILLAALGQLQQIIKIGSLTLLYLTLSVISGLVIGDTLNFVSLRLIGVSRAVPISSICPLFTVIIAALFLQGGVSSMVLLGAILVVFGVWLVSTKNNTVSPLTRADLIKGILAGVGAAIFWAISLVICQLALQWIDPITANSIRMIILTPALTMIVLASRNRDQLLHSDTNLWILLSAGGILALGVGGILLLVGISLIGVARAVPLSSTTPLYAPLLAMSLLKEKVTVKIISGAVLTVLGILLVIAG